MLWPKHIPGICINMYQVIYEAARIQHYPSHHLWQWNMHPWNRTRARSNPQLGFSCFMWSFGVAAAIESTLRSWGIAWRSIERMQAKGAGSEPVHQGTWSPARGSPTKSLRPGDWNNQWGGSYELKTTRPNPKMIKKWPKGPTSM